MAIVVALVLAGCNEPSPTAPSKATENPPAPTAVLTVRAVSPERKTVRHPIEQPGFNIEAFQETPLFAKVAGYVSKWNVDIGDPVHKNDVLATLYAPEMEVQVKQKEAAVRQAAAQIEQAKAMVLTAQAQVERLRTQYDRMSRVGKGGVLDQENVDEARLGWKSAEANLAKARADVAAAESQLEVAKADRDYAKTMLEYTTIRAPYDGVVTRRNVVSGDFVQPAANGVKGQPLFVVNQIDPVRVFVNVPGSDAPWINDGDPVTLQLQGAGGELLRGKVTRNARSLDAQSRTLRTEIDLPNPTGKLLPGMYVQATITVQHENVWALPAAAVVTEGDQTVGYRIEDGHAVRTPLQTGLKGSGLVEVLMKEVKISQSGDARHWLPLTDNEQFAIAEAGSLTNDQAVQIAPAAR